jgi:protein-S-isoprenylcysteine O-methyltransferase Ste14
MIRVSNPASIIAGTPAMSDTSIFLSKKSKEPSNGDSERPDEKAVNLSWGGPTMLARIRAMLQRYRVLLSALASVGILFLAKPTILGIAIGGLVSLLGVALRAWASGHLRKNEALTVSGPYAYTRNPLYLGSFLIGLGTTIACGSVFVVLVFIAFFAVVFTSAMIGEAGHLRNLFPGEFEAYEQSVPLFFPRTKAYRIKSQEQGFSSALYRAHQEYRVALGVLIALAVLLFIATRAGAFAAPLNQDATANNATTGPLARPLPFAEGESLTYEVKLSKLFISGTIGRLTFTFGSSEEKPLTNHYHLKVVAESDGFLTKLFGIKVHNVFESFVDKNDFGVCRTRKTTEEGQRKRFELAVFERDKGEVLLIRRDLKKATELPTTQWAGAQEWVQDIVSTVYFVRTQPLPIGQSVRIPLSDSAKSYDLDIEVIGEEKVQMGGETFDTIKVKPLIFGDRRLIEGAGEFYVWFTSDARRIPVKGFLRGDFGTVIIVLKK